MAISLIAKPETISPAYNPLRFIYSSTNVNNTGFRYIFDIYESGTATKIAEYRLLPNLDGYGEQDLSKLLQNYVTYDYDPNDATAAYFNATNSYYKYDVKIGEEYVTEVSYTASVTQNGSYVKITATHAFQVGDQVVITQDDGGAANPGLEGLFTVTAISTTVDFTVNSLWADVTDPTIDGTVKYSDNRKTVTRDIRTDLNNYVFNGAIPFSDYLNYEENDYILDANTDLLVTSMPLEISLTENQDVWINFMNNTITTGYVYFENSTGDIFRKAVTESGLITMCGIAPNNLGTLSLVSGSAPLVDNDMDSYEFWYANSAGTQHSLKYKINIDRRCVINNYEVLFLDRMGSLGSFAFQLRDYLTGTVQKETYNQYFEGYIDSQQWTYYTNEQGTRVINPTIKEVYQLNTNWMTENEAAYFTELVSSPQTWIKIDSSYYACIVEDTGYQKERSRNRNLIRKSIQVTLSVQDVVNG